MKTRICDVKIYRSGKITTVSRPLETKRRKRERLIHSLKSIGTVLLLLLIAALLTGAAAASTHPGKVFQMVFCSGLASFIAIAGIVAFGEWEHKK